MRIGTALDRCAAQFAGKHNIRSEDTADQMVSVAAGLVGRRLMYRDLITNPEAPSGAKRYRAEMEGL